MKGLVIRFLVFSLVFIEGGLRAEEFVNRTHILTSGGFVANRGQFYSVAGDADPVDFAFETESYQVYFTRSAVHYRFVYPNPAGSSEILSATGRQARKAMKGRRDTAWLHCEFELNGPHRWVGQSRKQVRSIYRIDEAEFAAESFESIRLQTAIPGIELEFTIHPETGIKYDLNVAPNADASQFRWAWSGSDPVTVSNVSGNVVVKSIHAQITDHAPVAFLPDGSAVSVSFERTGDVLSFDVGSYNTGLPLQIDPWVVPVNAQMTNNSNAYDVAYDASGNIYIAGGKGTNPSYRVAKFDASGNQLWVYSTGFTGYYGDMICDPSGNVYITEGAWEGKLIKISSAGSQLWSTNLPTSNAYEAWALSIDPCDESKIVVSWLDGSYNVRIAYLNSTTGAVSSATGTGLSHEIRSLCHDPSGNLYGLMCNMSTSGNKVFGRDATLGALFSVNSGYGIEEWSPAYTGSNAYTGGGYNGIAASACNLFTTNGAQLHKRDKNTGASVQSIAIPSGSADNNGGIAVDLCGNVYVGSQNGVYVFDSLLNQINYSNTSGNVYDVQVNHISGEVLACGDNFLASIDLSACTGSVCGGTSALTVSASDSVICVGDTIYLLSSSTSTSWTPAQDIIATSGDTTWVVPTGNTTYAASATSSVACMSSSATASVSITVSSAPNLILTNPTVLCSGGTADLTQPAVTSGSVGVVTLSYFSDPALTNALSDPAAVLAGTYYIQAESSEGCKTDGLVQVSQSAAVNPQISVDSAPSCGNSDGSLSALGASSGPYIWAWSSGATDQTISGIGAGNYTVTMTDSNGCSDSVSVTLQSGAAPTLTIQNQIHPACSGDSTGSVSVSVSGGLSPMTYLWQDNSSTNGVAGGYPAGTFSVTVTDDAGCIAMESFTLTEPTALTAVISQTDPSCGGSDGVVSVVASGGVSPYAFIWSNSGTEQQITGLQAGEFSLTITDANGCSLADSVSLLGASSATVAISQTQALTCFGASDGIADAVVSGGQSPFLYAWSQGTAMGSSVTDLAAGVLIVTVTDSDGCSTSASMTIMEPDSVSSTVSTIPETCGMANGSASIVVSGGSSPYDYVWSNGNTVTSASSLSSGNYSVTVTDGGGCMSVIAFSIASNPVPVLSQSVIQQPTCYNSADGSIDLTVTGGSAPIQISWTPAVATTLTATGLGSGTYQCIITDSDGCMDTVNATLAAPDSLSIVGNAVDPGCNSADGAISLVVSGGSAGYNFLWSSGQTLADLSGLGAGNYTVTVTDSQGCTSEALFSLQSAGGLNISAMSTDLSCADLLDGTAGVTITSGASPYSYQWSTGSSSNVLTGLVSGTYTVTVTDANGCTASANAVVGSPGLLLADSDVLSVNCSGSSGSANIMANGGESPYGYQWSSGETSASIVVETPGTYSYTVTDINGCEATGNAVVGLTGSLMVDASPEESAIVQGETVPLSATGAENYHWTPSGSLSCPDCGSTSATPTQTTQYIVTGSDSLGCLGSDTVVIYVEIPCGEVFVADVFSPNGDGVNDFVFVRGNCFSSLHFVIYDRWGERVFETNDPSVAWNGTYRDDGMNTAVFVFLLTYSLTTEPDVTQSMQGNITLVR